MADQSEYNTLLSPRFLFQFAVPIRRKSPLWTQTSAALDESYRLPNLAALDARTSSQEPSFADVRMAWDVKGLAIHAFINGKHQPPWCRDSRPEDSDGMEIWIDTRATHNVHRATKFCHRFIFLPTGGGRGSAEPVAEQALINRARENAPPIRPRELQAKSKVTKTGYELSVLIPATALAGFDPANHRSIGFTYAIRDRELGLATFSSGTGFPFDEDPSCWATVEMVE